MKKTSKGFSLIECLIYCAVTSFLSVMVFTYFNRTLLGVQLFAHQQQNILSQWSVQQMLRKDIQMASCQPAEWFSDATTMICRAGSDSIGWHVRNSNLYRTKGEYNFSAHSWNKKSTSLVAQGVKAFDIIFEEKQSTITCVTCNLKMRNSAFQAVIPLRNKIIG